MTRQLLVELLESEDVLYAPGVWDGLSARLADQAGFKALCASGFAIAAGLGLPDAEVFTATENLEAVRKLREASSLPVIADIDTGYGNAINAARTAASFRRAGVSAVFMEDQLSPKRCPICVGDPVDVIPTQEAVGKIRAVVDAVEREVMVIARTDATGDDAVRRAEAYVAAGADIIMPVSKTFADLSEWKRCHEAVGVPLMAALTAWTWVERDFTREAMVDAGVKIALLPTQVVLAATTAMRDTLSRLANGDLPRSVSTDYMEHTDFIKMIGFPQMEVLQQQYLPETIEEIS
jgi:2-methylisocitrate lyase-like PEP mutase family enzyme